MSFFDRFRRKKASTEETPAAVSLNSEQLLETLLAALHDEARLRELCRQYASQIADCATSWRVLPVEIRKDRVLVQERMERLIALAVFLDEKMNAPALMKALQGNPQDNPIEKCHERMRQASELAKSFRAEEAIQLLSDTLIETRNLQMFGNQSLRGMLHGVLGAILFHSGRPSESRAHFEKALEFCGQQNDAEGVTVYHCSLYENLRYLGEPEAAAQHSDALAKLYEAAGKTSFAHRQARLSSLARSGEPLNRVVAIDGDKTLELDELHPPFEGKYQFIFARNRTALGDSERLVRRAGEAFSAGRTDDALDDLRRAAKIDPFYPDPHYQMGLVLMKQELYGQAVEAYEKTEALAPGWFHVRADLWLARQLELGRFDHGLFMGAWYLADAGDSPAEKRKAGEKLLQRYPDVPLIHLLHGQTLAALGLCDEAARILRSGLEADPEPDVHTRLLVQMALLLESGPERRSLLQRAIELNGNLVGAAMARIML